MFALEHFSPIEVSPKPSWQSYLLDSLLASLGALSITGFIYIFQLYPRIPNVSIVYLLLVLALASTRGRYPAILASLVAFLAFDFFLVPPLYVFTINRVEEWIALFVFLVTAVLTSQLTVALRQRAKQANRREHEARILYALVRETNSEENLDHQLQIIAEAIVAVFSSWGVCECAILLPNATGVLSLQASTPQPIDQAILSPDERATAAWVMAHGQTMSLYDDIAHAPFKPVPSTLSVVVRSTTFGCATRRSLRFVPLKASQHVVGVLRLRLQDDRQQFAAEQHLGEAIEHPNERTAFFGTFLDQAMSVIERARLRRESMDIEVLRRTDALRAALLSSVSHDLRTPLASIKAAASSLLQEDVDWDNEARHSFAQTIEREADRLNRLVGNLLDMSRIEEGALKPEKEWYLLAELINDVLDRLRPMLQGRAVRTHLSADLPPIELDYLQMDQVLTNLIENAVRYTPAESPIDISVQREAERVVIQVADRGPGIPPTDLERVFDKFYRVLSGHNGSRHPSGSGLGLAVCKGLVEAHGGRIWAQQREGGGTIFSVELPIGTREGVSL